MEPQPAVRPDATRAQTTRHAQGEMVQHIHATQDMHNVAQTVAVPAQLAVIAQGITQRAHVPQTPDIRRQHRPPVVTQ